MCFYYVADWQFVVFLFYFSVFGPLQLPSKKDDDECIIMPGHVLGRSMRKAKSPMTILLIKLLDRTVHVCMCVCVNFCFKYSGPNRCKCCPLSRFHGSPTFGLDSWAAEWDMRMQLNCRPVGRYRQRLMHISCARNAFHA